MADRRYEFEGALWEYQGEAPWVFVTLPQHLADEIDNAVEEPGGFGSVKVEVTAGNSVWSTSLFPDRSSGSFVLPVKKEIRRVEALSPGDEAMFRLRLLVD